MAAAQRPSERWRALGILKESWAKLERTRLLFPALLPPAEAPPRRGLGLRLESGSGRGGVDYDDEMWRCGRRAACRSPVLLPGLFHMLQARVANRYGRRLGSRGRSPARRGCGNSCESAFGASTDRIDRYIGRWIE